MNKHRGSSFSEHMAETIEEYAKEIEQLRAENARLKEAVTIALEHLPLFVWDKVRKLSE